MPKRSPTPTGWLSLTKQTIRRATSPAIWVTALRWPVAEAEFARRWRGCDLADRPVGRSDDEAVAHRRHPRRVAEEIDAPQRQHGPEPAERRPDPEQQQGHEREGANEGIALRRDRRALLAGGFF